MHKNKFVKEKILLGCIFHILSYIWKTIFSKSLFIIHVSKVLLLLLTFALSDTLLMFQKIIILREPSCFNNVFIDTWMCTYVSSLKVSKLLHILIVDHQYEALFRRYSIKYVIIYILLKNLFVLFTILIRC